jgi:hypothetical protein
MIESLVQGRLSNVVQVIQSHLEGTELIIPFWPMIHLAFAKCVQITCTSMSA